MTTAPKSPDDHCKECGGDANKIPGHYAYCSTQKRDPIPDWEGMAKRFIAGQPKQEHPKATDRAGREGLFSQYRRTQIAEMRPVILGEVLSDRVSISAPDREAGSPKVGDMIARNPANHADQWLVAATYFAVNFEPITDTRSDGGGAGEIERLKAEVARLNALINTPEIDSFLLAVQIEQAHQRVRWGQGFDEKKSAGDWSLLMDKLKGKMALAHWDGDREKYLHHLVTMAAVCFNAHRCLVPAEDTPEVTAALAAQPQHPSHAGIDPGARSDGSNAAGNDGTRVTTGPIPAPSAQTRLQGDEAVVEAAARALVNRRMPVPWDALSDNQREEYRDDARAALAARAGSST